MNKLFTLSTCSVLELSGVDNGISSDYIKALHKGLNGVMNFAIGYTEVAVVICMCGQFGYGLTTGGPPGLFWSWMLTFFMTMFVAFSMAEICSAFPKAGAVYNWAGQLVPKPWTPLASYICGLFNFVGNFFSSASYAMCWAQFLSAAMITSNCPDGFRGFYDKSLVGIAIAVLFLWAVLNCFRVDQLGCVGYFSAIVQVCSVFIIVVIIVARAPSLQSSTFVFVDYYNSSGFSDRTYVGAISLITALYSFSGYEASAQISEETLGSKMAAPMGIIYTCLATGLTGMALLLGLLFCTDDISAIVGNDDDDVSFISSSSYVPSGNAAVEVFRRSSGPGYGAGLAWLLVINGFFAGMSSVTITGRITFALARDAVFPFSDVVATLDPRLQSPRNALLFIWFLGSCVIILQLGSAVAFTSITAISTIGYQISYAIPIILKLAFHNDYFEGKVAFPNTEFSLTSWSRPIGFIASMWLVASSFVLFLPTLGPFSAITNDTMNWSVVIVFGLVVIALLNWIFNARFHFKGPIRFMDEKAALAPTDIHPSAATLSEDDELVIVMETKT